MGVEEESGESGAVRMRAAAGSAGGTSLSSRDNFMN